MKSFFNPVLFLSYKKKKIFASFHMLNKLQTWLLWFGWRHTNQPKLWSTKISSFHPWTLTAVETGLACDQCDGRVSDSLLWWWRTRVIDWTQGKLCQAGHQDQISCLIINSLLQVLQRGTSVMCCTSKTHSIPSLRSPHPISDFSFCAPVVWVFLIHILHVFFSPKSLT